MRYLLFLFLFICSSAFSAQPFLGNYCDSPSVCNAFISNLNSNPSSTEYGGACSGTNPNYHCAPIYFRCSAPTVNYPAQPDLCVPVCTAPQILNIVTVNGVSSGSCIDPPVDDVGDPFCDESEKVFDPSSGQMVCPGSGDSSSSSSQTCVVPGDFNGDCVPDDEQGSSASNSSTPTSNSTSSPSSTPSNGDGDDNGNPSTGGGNGGGGGSSGGSGSAAASSSVTGSNSSWTPNSGYGNWIPVDEDSNCPNKYKDNAGQWWCSGSTNQGSAGSASGACDPTATNYWSCINSGSAGSAGSSGSASSDDTEGKLTDKGDEIIEGLKEDIDSELDDFEKGYTDDIDQFVNDGVSFENDPSAIKSLLISFLPVSTSCNPPSIKFFGKNHELDCEYFNIFKQALGWFLAILTAYQIWQMAIRPVER